MRCLHQSLDKKRLVLFLIAQNKSTYQLYIKSAFCMVNYKKKFILINILDLWLKDLKIRYTNLKKILYSLKQAPKALYSHIDAYFVTHGFEKYLYKYTLFEKYGEAERILIIYLYLDIIYAGNDVNMINQF